MGDPKPVGAATTRFIESNQPAMRKTAFLCLGSLVLGAMAGEAWRVAGRGNPLVEIGRAHV
jgi:hypothetical protein